MPYSCGLWRFANAYNPAFKKGETVTLNGEMAQQYVRYRDTNVSGSNNERMERQSLFIEALVQQLQEEMQGTKDVVQLYKKIVLNKYSISKNKIKGLKKSHCIWILLAKISFMKTCKIRNLLKIGV